jgi:hypothetical protein
VCGIDEGAHLFDVPIIYNGVDGEIRAYPALSADTGNAVQIAHRKVVGGLRSHIQAFDSEIDGIGSCAYGGCQGFVRPYGRHQFISIGFFHDKCKLRGKDTKNQELTGANLILFSLVFF